MAFSPSSHREGDDATLGKRKASLTADESAKAQKIASIEQGLYIYNQWRSVQHGFGMPAARRSGTRSAR